VHRHALATHRGARLVSQQSAAEELEVILCLGKMVGCKRVPRFVCRQLVLDKEVDARPLVLYTRCLLLHYAVQ
jgi:hypothetical protein